MDGSRMEKYGRWALPLGMALVLWACAPAAVPHACSDGCSDQGARGRHTGSGAHPNCCLGPGG